MTTETFGIAVLVLIAFVVQRRRLKSLVQANLRLSTDKREADRRLAILQQTLEERDRRAERSRQNSIQDANNQIDAVNNVSVNFSIRPVMNRGEARVFYAAKTALKKRRREGWHVFPQVSLGEIIGTGPDSDSRADRAHQSINSKRCDILIADGKGRPVIVLEYQGSGHYQGTADLRDTVKRIAITRAGIKFIEIEGRTNEEQIIQIIETAL